MNIPHLSKFSIFMISIVVLAIVVYGIIVLTSPSGISSQNDRIYLYSSIRPGSSGNYVKISDMLPNDFGYFMYPSSYNFSDNANAYQKFILIRLSKIMGGDKNDTSSATEVRKLPQIRGRVLLVEDGPDNQRLI